MTATDVISGQATWAIDQADVLAWLRSLPDASVYCCVTSPPYYLLRDYKLPPSTWPDGWLGCLGLEPTAEMYLAHLLEVFAGVRRVLRPDGTAWVNMGDTFAANGGSHAHEGMEALGNKYRGGGHSLQFADRPKRQLGQLAAGNLGGIPWRLALAMQEQGWILRSDIVWAKPSAMPESVAGWAWRRCRRRIVKSTTNLHPAKTESGRSDVGKHSGNHRINAQWEGCPGCPKCVATGGYILRRGSWRPTRAHEFVFLFAKTGDYYCDGEAVKQPPAAATTERDRYSRVLDDPDEQFAVRHDHETVCSGANLRDVWTISPEPSKLSHYAAYPSALVERCLRAGTSANGVCPKCGAPWARVLAVQGWDQRQPIGWRPTCDCPAAEPIPALVMDPFAGTGTTILTAHRLGLRAIGCDLSAAYCEMARRRVMEDAPLLNGVHHA